MENIKQFIFALAVNMVFRIRFLIAVPVCLGLHFLCGIPLWVTWAAAGGWVIYSIIVTLLMTFVLNCDKAPLNQKGISLNPGRNAAFDKMYRSKEMAGVKADPVVPEQSEVMPDLTSETNSNALSQEYGKILPGKFCPECGNKVSENAKYCSACGTSLFRK